MSQKLNYDVEFLPVGDGTKAGDAIVISYGVDAPEEVLVVDGGTVESGEAMVKHIQKYFGPRTIITHLVSTHPDSDHASGLRLILENFTVANVWLHGLWYHVAEIMHLFKNKKWTPDGLARAIKSEYSIIDELIELARSRGAKIYEPFQGVRIGPFLVLSPTRFAYQHLVPQFRKTPEPDVDRLKQLQIWIEPRTSLLGNLIEKVVQLIPENWEVETLREGGVTAAENESSVVLYGDFGESAVLLTADAGVNSLTWAYDYGSSVGIDFTKIGLIQVPHHGSRNNVSPSLLNHIVGPKQPRGQTSERLKAIVSAPKDDENHPRKVVMNAFLRRGAPVRTTQGSKYRYHKGFPAREDYVVAKPLGFFDKVEEYD